jgi:hypothetical protein
VPWSASRAHELAAVAFYPKVDCAMVSLLAKPVGVWAGSQPWIYKGEQSGLQTLIAATESVSLLARMKS